MLILKILGIILLLQIKETEAPEGFENQYQGRMVRKNQHRSSYLHTLSISNSQYTKNG